MKPDEATIPSEDAKKAIRHKLKARYNSGVLKALVVYVAFAFLLALASESADKFISVEKDSGKILIVIIKAFSGTLSSAVGIFTAAIVVNYYKEGFKARKTLNDYFDANAPEFSETALGYVAEREGLTSASKHVLRAYATTAYGNQSAVQPLDDKGNRVSTLKEFLEVLVK